MKIRVNNPKMFKKLNDIYPELLYGVIYNFTDSMLPPLLNVVKFDMSVEYMSRSGTKAISTLVENLLQEYPLRHVINEYTGDSFYMISSQAQTNILKTLEARFKTKWQKLYETITAEYDALNPYDMTINEETTDTLTSSGTNLSNKVDTGTKSSNETVSGERDDSLYGFNSPQSVPTDESQTSSESTVNDEVSNNSTIETSNEYTRSNPTTRELTRKGNIGNITKQELLEKERDVWQWQIWDVIFKDLDSVLTRSKYI